MKTFAPVTLALASLALVAGPAEAKGCLKGAAVGGVGGQLPAESQVPAEPAEDAPMSRAGANHAARGPRKKRVQKGER